jgi:RNA polymerase sigma factor (sigma-70 family)
MERAFDLEELLAESGWLRQLAASLVGDGGRADDLVQDTWLAALRRPPRTAEEPRPWLARVVANLARNERRGRARRAERELRVHEERVEPGPDALAQAAEAQRMLAEAVTRLDEPLRAVVVLRYFQGLDSRAAAERLGVPDSTVRTRLQRALEELRADLDRRCKGGRSAWAVLLAPLTREAQVGTAGAAMASAGASLATWGVLLAAAGVLGVLALGARMWSAARAEEQREHALAAVASAAEHEPDEPALSTSGDSREPVAGLASAPDARGVSGQPPADFQSEVSGTVLVDGRPPEWPIELTLEPELPPAEPDGRRRRMPKPVLTLAPEQRGAFAFPNLPADWRGRIRVYGFRFADGGNELRLDEPSRGLVLALVSAPEIVGRIVAPDGAPVPELQGRVRLLCGPVTDVMSLEETIPFACRADGRFRIPGPVGHAWCELELVVEAEGVGGLRHLEPTFVPDARHDLGLLVLESVGALRFTVRSSGGAPLAGAVARLEPVGLSRGSPPTLDDGSGVLAWMPERSTDVRFAALGYADRVLHVEPGIPVEVTLDPLAVLELRLQGPLASEAKTVRLTADGPAFVWDASAWKDGVSFQIDNGADQPMWRRWPPQDGPRNEYGFRYTQKPLTLVGLVPGQAFEVVVLDSKGRTLAGDVLAVDPGARAVLEFGEPDPEGANAVAEQVRRSQKSPR